MTETQTFTELGVEPQIVRALHEVGIDKPTIIQQKAIPLASQGKDLIGMSRTGSGKTVAFGIPVLEIVQPNAGLQAIIMTPTRELAVQIARELEKFAKYTPRNIALAYGGVGIDQQAEKIAYADILVSTPGRTLDLLQRRMLDLTKIKCFVLDEADKMVEMGFIEDVEEILKATPDNRQILLFGATLSNEIDHIKLAYMNEPIIAEAAVHVKEDLLQQYYYNVLHHEKFSLLVHLLKKEERDRAIIFCSARSTVELLAHNLKNQGLKVAMIHGKLSQNKRQHVIDQFNEGRPEILIASAVAARGIHIEGVSHVFNYDLSKDPQEYIHRVGRTARAGESGVAITLLSPRDHGTFSAILNRYPLDIKELPDEQFQRLRFETRTRDDRNRRGFSRHRHQRGYSSPRGSHTRIR